MFIKVNVRLTLSNGHTVREMRLNPRFISDYWQGTEAGVVMLSHNRSTLAVLIDIATLDAMLVG